MLYQFIRWKIIYVWIINSELSKSDKWHIFGGRCNIFENNSILEGVWWGEWTKIKLSL